MDEQNLTDWFPPEVLPARAGVYELDDADDDGRCFARFDGEHWYYGVWEFSFGKRQDVLRRALLQPVRRHGSRSYRWRGLAEPPTTDWFDPGTPPEREGVYELEAQNGEIRAFAYWSPGHGWGHTYYATHWGDDWAIRAACQGRSRRGLIAPARRWRGLAVQP